VTIKSRPNSSFLRIIRDSSHRRLLEQYFTIHRESKHLAGIATPRQCVSYFRGPKRRPEKQVFQAFLTSVDIAQLPHLVADQFFDGGLVQGSDGRAGVLQKWLNLGVGQVGDALQVVGGGGRQRSSGRVAVDLDIGDVDTVETMVREKLIGRQ
jgi:hypothetical protein